MHKYSEQLIDVTDINLKSGGNAVIPMEFELLFARLQRGVNQAQCNLQTFVFESHHDAFLRAASSLKQHTSTKARVEFLVSLAPINSDDVLCRVFEYAKELFAGVVEFRHLIAHSIWLSSDIYPSRLIVSELANEAKLLLAKARVNSDPEMTTKQTYESIVRYISELHIISIEGLAQAVDSVDIVNVCVMQVSQALRSKSEAAEEIKRGFKVFRGISHLFPPDELSVEPVNQNLNSSNTIYR